MAANSEKGEGIWPSPKFLPIQDNQRAQCAFAEIRHQILPAAALAIELATGNEPFSFGIETEKAHLY